MESPSTETEGPRPNLELERGPELEQQPEARLPSLVSVLPQRMLYLKLYKPFVTAFPESIAKLSANQRLRDFDCG